MRRTREEAAETRRTAIEAASKLYRERGLDAVSVGNVMSALGMTVGGFYRHFDSKDALIAEACARAFVESVAGHEVAVRSAGKRMQPLEAFLARYLSEAHRDGPASGCPVPALVSNISHQSSSVRRAFTTGVKGLLSRIEKLSPDAEPREWLAMVAGMVGALALARAVDDEVLSARFLRESRRFWTRAVGKQPSGRSTRRRRRGSGEHRA